MYTKSAFLSILVTICTLFSQNSTYACDVERKLGHDFAQYQYDLFYHLEQLDPDDMDDNDKYWFLIGKIEALKEVLRYIQ